MYQGVYLAQTNFALTSGTRRTYFFKAVSRFGRLVAGLILPRPAFDVRQVPVTFVVDEVDVRQHSLPITWDFLTLI